MLEEMLIEHGAPTLAGIKTGNLFRAAIDSHTDINREVRELNHLLNDKGLRIIPLKRTDRYVLIYIYRPEYLKKDLKCPEAACILNQKGYDCDKADQCIKKLAGHLMMDDTFPHEIGLFLGYPPKDVQGFIDNPCSGVKCVGCWKVYSDEEKAERIFKKYKKCTEVYMRLNKNGRTLAALAVNTSKYMAG
ncbi:MAG: DUF3793 family protein [Lachnospiraceae bacterium]|nr:DUF3793 family protein [Lachnospiraceae bacterium]